MFPVCTLFQHFQKTVHNGSILRGNIAFPINAGVEIEKIENGRLHGVDKRFAVKAMFRVPDALFQQFEIAAADKLLFRREVYDGIEKKSQ